MISIDLINTFATVLLKPMLIVGLLYLALHSSNLRSAAQNHYLMIMVLIFLLLSLLLARFLPSLGIRVLPAHWPLTTSIDLSQQHLATNTYTLLLLGTGIYLLGMFWRLSFTAWAFKDAGKIVQSATVGMTEDLQVTLHSVKRILDKEFGFADQRVNIRLSEQVATPVVFGWRKAKILVPQAMVSWPEARVKRVLCHEYAHIERGDWLSKWLCSIGSAVLWFLPPVWWLVKRIDWLSEVACDDRVTELYDCRAEYADDLLAVSVDAKHQAAFVLSYADRSMLYQRIKLVLEPSRNKTRPGWGGRVLLFLLAFALVAPLAFAHLAPLSGERYPDLTTLYPAQVAVPMVQIEESSPIANNTRRIAWLNRQLQLQATPAKSPTKEESQQISEQVFLPGDLPERPTESMIISMPRNGIGKTITRKPSAQVHTAPGSMDINTPSVAISGYIPAMVITPEYPRRALQKGISGRVVVEFDVNEQGQVQAPRIISAQPANIFNQAVLEAVSEFRFTPLYFGSEAVITKNVTETFVFNLE